MNALRSLVLPLALAVLSALPCAAQGVARKVFRVPEGGANLLRADGWAAAAGRQVVREGEAFVCDNGAQAGAVHGIHQSVVLDQKTPQPIVAVAWSRAEGVGGSRDADYSLYLDLRYQDGTPLWGQSASFEVGTHDWQKAVVKIIPSKPVKDLTVHLLMRRHAGKALFRGMELRQVELAAGAAMFDGVAVEAGADGKGGPANDLPAGLDGFSVRDVAADSEFVSFEKGLALGLKLTVTPQPVPAGRHYVARLEDTTGKDRAVTLVFARRLAPPASGGPGFQWLIDPRRSEPARPPRDYQQSLRVGAGHDGRLGWYPLAAVAPAPDSAAPPGPSGRAVCLDMARPAVFRTGFSAALHELYIAFDLALTPERPHAEVALAALDFDPAWGFRGAVQAMYDAFPEHFRRRVDRQGVWMPFAPISKVDGWQDFGFAFKEGNDETAWDDANAILTFRYTEPMTWWMAMPKDMPRTYQAALAHAKALALKGDRNARALMTSGMHDERGQFVCRLLDTPWCNGAVWSMNTTPGVSGEITDWNNKWNPALRDKLYGPGRKGDLDGEYVDSSEGYVTAELNFRRDHFAAAAFPLTFETQSLRAGIFRGLVAGEYVAAQARDVHAMGKLMMANGTPHALCWLAPHLDVLGTETDWNRSRRWQPMSDAELLFRRCLCGPKPYCFLMNTHFEDFGYELSEKFMKRCLAYGMFPGYFSQDAATRQYFTRKELYDRDRPLFKKYLPLCRRVAQAAWQPVTLARSSDPKVHVERWGKSFLTVFNDSPGRRTATIRIEGGLASAGKSDLVSGREIRWKGCELELTLEGEDVAVVEVK